MCDCQDTIRMGIKEDLFAEGKSMTYLVFDMSTIQNMTLKKQGKTVEKKTGQRVEIKYSFMDKKGVEKFKIEKSFVSHEFCPWCGRRYDGDL